jgi:hypothetical protein
MAETPKPTMTAEEWDRIAVGCHWRMWGPIILYRVSVLGVDHHLIVYPKEVDRGEDSRTDRD